MMTEYVILLDNYAIFVDNLTKIKNGYFQVINILQASKGDIDPASNANLLKRYQELCEKPFTANTLTVDIRWLTKAGTHQPITAQGRKVMVKSMKELGVIVMERILVQQLP
jgi:hypothetical protein